MTTGNGTIKISHWRITGSILDLKTILKYKSPMTDQKNGIVFKKYIYGNVIKKKSHALKAGIFIYWA
jgi:hypothetical protein